MACVRVIVTCVMFSAVLVGEAPISGAADPWTEVGATDRPKWVSASTERRLRLVPALPAMKANLQAQATGYFGSQGPGMSVGLVLDDGLFYSEGFGFRDEAKTHRPDEFTVYRPGSLTKVFTAATLLTLVDSGAVSMDHDAAMYVPEVNSLQKPACDPGLPCNVPIKLRNLPSHTSGLPNEMHPAAVDEPTWIMELQASKLAFWPGSFSAYSGVGAELEGLIIKRVSGKELDAYMTEHLLTPLGMLDTRLDHAKVAPGLLAQKYVLTWPPGGGAPTFNINKAWDNPMMLVAAGNLYTSVADLSRFMQMELTAKAPGVLSEPLIRASQLSAVPSSGLTPTAACSDPMWPASSYRECQDASLFGYGWYVGNSPYIEHNGAFGAEWGSQTRFHVEKLMGATGLLSTEPFPNAPSGTTQPADIDPQFMYHVVNGLLDAGISADVAASWTGQRLAVGLARILYLSGKHPDQKDIQAFTADFVSAHNLGKSTIVPFLNTWHSEVVRCSSFRVREVIGAGTLKVRFTCDGGNWETLVHVEDAAPYKVAWWDVGSKVPPIKKPAP
jgi:CubicO group peptidase (beta-lactamase class C family)